MGYVLIRHGDGRYVAVSGSDHSYTNRLERAAIFASREVAERNACGNESAVPVPSLLTNRS